MKLLNKVIIAIILTLFAASFIGGCQYGKARKKCPQITRDTILVYDTVSHYIVDSFPYYVLHTDTIIYRDTVFKDVDTAVILKDYFALHVYSREWKDDSIQINLRDTVTQNRFLHNYITYKFKVPFTTIINTVDSTKTFNRYWYIGADIPISNPNYVELESTFNWDKAYVGIGYTPQLKSFNVKAGVKILQFKKKK